MQSFSFQRGYNQLSKRLKLDSAFGQEAATGNLGESKFHEETQLARFQDGARGKKFTATTVKQFPCDLRCENILQEKWGNHWGREASKAKITIRAGLYF